MLFARLVPVVVTRLAIFLPLAICTSLNIACTRAPSSPDFELATKKCDRRQADFTHFSGHSSQREQLTLLLFILMGLVDLSECSSK